jgi:4-hydroxybenzoate polyprenyltransferase/phosphoserine phosphatase
MVSQPDADISVPLCVDLDDTLVKTDLLFETLVLLAKYRPVALLALPIWFIQGRGYLKEQIAQRVKPEISRLPFRRGLIDFLRAEKMRGRTLVLVTAADHGIAEEVNAHLQLFDETIGSRAGRNLKGKQKAALLMQRYGAKGFDYVGDSHSDFAVWRVSRRALVVSERPAFIKAVAAVVPVDRTFPKTERQPYAWLRALRLHQWSKNFLVFVPIITAHKVLDAAILLRGLIAFVSFSFICSAVYLVNDLMDLEADRAHETKRLRALAAGELSILHAVLLTLALFLAGGAIGVFLGLGFLIVIAIYIAANLTYSIMFKRIIMLDVVMLAGFYALRLLAGGAATALYCSEWLLAFSIFFFFCLAMVKRFSELQRATGMEETVSIGRGYKRSDLEAIGSFGTASGLISVLVFVLYIMSPDVRVLYRRPAILLLLCPLFLYWITRIWFKAKRGEIPEDPVVFALTDPTSYLAGLWAMLVLFAATVE